MYRIAVCDDEPVFLQTISEMTADILKAQGEICDIRKFPAVDALKSALAADPNAFDLLLLDILFGEENGIQFAEYLRDTGNRIPIIFITSSKDFVFDAYSAEPVGYVMKPVDREELTKALLRAVRRMQLDTIVVDTPSKTVSFRIQDVIFIEVYNKTLLVHMQDGTTTEILKTLSAIGENLPHDRFVQCHRCYIVSLSFILSIKRYEITLKNHTKIPISKNYYRSVQECLQQYAAKWF